MLNAVKQTIASALNSSVLLIGNLLVASIVLVLIALTLMKHFEETPELRNLICFVGLQRSDCPQYGSELAKLRGELKALEDQRDIIEERLASLSAIEHSVDQITLFETKAIEGSGLTTTIGTVYSRLTGDDPTPDYYYCYLVLPEGSAGETRNLSFFSHGKEISVTNDQLQKAGVSRMTLDGGREHCRPFLIGQDA